ncbi:MAG: UDP-3-O-acyl-N-acetylglucosamine deacetylase [Nitrospirota bacterium]
MRYQRTIKREIEISGIGLHSGKKVRIRISPASIDTGVVFIRNDVNNRPNYIKAKVNNVISTDLCTTLKYNGTAIHTIEHLMASIAGLNIDNLYIEVDSSEIPIMDGSAFPFTSLLLNSGIEEQKKIQSCMRITREIKIEEGNKKIIVKPASTNKILYTIDFDHHIVSKQSISYYPSQKGFIKEIAKARTFAFLKDIDEIRSRGMARGGSLDNAIVIGNNEILNNDGLRYKDEFVRHKVLDLVGDLSLLGMPVLGKVISYCSGHSLNIKLAAKILESPDSWVIEGASSKKLYSKEKEYNLSLNPVFT